MTYIIIAALALVVLVVIILFFTGGIGSLFGQQKDAVDDVSEQQLEIWRGQCKMHCKLEKNKQGNCPNFCNYEKKGWSCMGTVPGTDSLGVDCELFLVKEGEGDKTKSVSVSLNEEGVRCDCS